MTVAAQLIDDVLRRVRDPQGTAHPRTTVLDLIDRAQVLYVRSTGTLIQERPFTLTTPRLVYDVDPQASLRFLDLFIGERRLWPIRWSAMVQQLGPTWWRTTDINGPRTWAPLGTTHFVVFPSPTAANTTLTIREQKRPTPLTSETVAMDLKDEFFPRLLDYVESLLLLRQRDAALPSAFASVEQRLGESPN